MLAIAKLQAPAEIHEPEARFSEANVFQKLMLASGEDGSSYIPCCMCSGTILIFTHTRGTLSCALDSRNVDEQMSLRGIGAGSTEESRSRGEGWTA